MVPISFSFFCMCASTYTVRTSAWAGRPLRMSGRGGVVLGRHFDARTQQDALSLHAPHLALRVHAGNGCLSRGSESLTAMQRRRQPVRARAAPPEAGAWVPGGRTSRGFWYRCGLRGFRGGWQCLALVCVCVCGCCRAHFAPVWQVGYVCAAHSAAGDWAAGPCVQPASVYIWGKLQNGNHAAAIAAAHTNARSAAPARLAPPLCPVPPAPPRQPGAVAGDPLPSRRHSRNRTNKRHRPMADAVQAPAAAPAGTAAAGAAGAAGNWHPPVTATSPPWSMIPPGAAPHQ